MSTKSSRHVGVDKGGVPARKIFEKLRSLSSWRAFRCEFLNTTRLPLSFEPLNGFSELSENGTRFCRMVNCDCTYSCLRCPKSTLDGVTSAVPSSSLIKPCGAGLQHASFPIRMGEDTVAWLVTGQAMLTRPSVQSFVATVALDLSRYTTEEIGEMAQAYLQIPVIAPEDFRYATALLAAFAAQLGYRINRILIEPEDGEPESVRKARRIVGKNAPSRTCPDLDPGVSEYTFEEFTGMDFGEFRKRCALEKARSRLGDPSTSVRKIPIESGFRSEVEMQDAFQTYFNCTAEEYRKRTQENIRLLSKESDFSPL